MGSLAGMSGQPTMVLFWNPGCGFCAGMLDELREWDHSRSNGATQLLVVSSGTPEAHAEMQLHSPVVLDDASQTMSAYGAHGTPMAVLVDGEGNVASNLAVGAVEVMNLARSKVGSFQSAGSSGVLDFSSTRYHSGAYAPGARMWLFSMNSP